MTKRINVLYISLTGNTKHFMGRLADYFATQAIVLKAINVKENPEPTTLTDPFVAFLPTFLKGGNGVDNGYTEILTNKLGTYLDFAQNYQHWYGIIGSGNRNFNKQFALTAKQYAERFGFPYLTDFELRGTKSDVPRIANIILKQCTAFTAQEA